MCWSNAVYVCVCVHVNQGVAQMVSAAQCTQSYNLACTNLLMNPDCTPTARSVRPTLQVKIARR